MSAELRIDFNITENIEESAQRAQDAPAQPQSPAPQPSSPEPKPASPQPTASAQQPPKPPQNPSVASASQEPNQPRRSIFGKPKPVEQQASDSVKQTAPPKAATEATKTTEPAKPDIFNKAPQVLTEPPERRIPLDVWEQLGADAEAVAKQMKMLPPLEVERKVKQPPERDQPERDVQQQVVQPRSPTSPPLNSGPQRQPMQPTSAIQREAKERLQRMERAKAVDQEMRRQSDEYRTAKEAAEERREKPKPDQEAGRRIERSRYESSVDQEMRKQDPQYAAQAEEKDARAKSLEEARKLADAKRVERVAYAQMTEEEKVAHLAEQKAAKELTDHKVKEAVEQKKRQADPAYARQAEEKEARDRSIEENRKLTDARREERVALAQMTEEERIAYKAEKEANRLREKEAVQQRVKDLRQAEQPPAEEKKFDPYAEAQKQREREVRKEQIKAAQEEMYGGKKTATDHVLDAAQKMRGTIGGMLGPIPGAVLDVVTEVRKHSQKPEARREAERRNKEAKKNIPEATRVEDMPVATQAPPRTQEQPEAAVAEPPRRENPSSPFGGLKQQEQPQQVTQRQSTNSPLGQERATQAQLKQPAQPAQPAQSAAQPAQSAVKAPPAQPSQAAGAAQQPAAAGASSNAAAAAESGVAAEGAAAAGALGELAAVAGPIGAVAVAVVMAAQKVREGSEAAIRSVSNTAASFASLKDGAARLDEIGDAAGKAADSLTYINPAASIVVGSLGALSKGVAQMDRAVKGTADQLAQYHGGLAAQQAQQDVAELIRNINRAQQHGDQVQRTNQSRFEMDQKIQDLTDRIMPWIMDKLDELFKVATNFFTIIEPFLPAVLGLLDEILVAIKTTSGVGILIDILALIARWTRRSENTSNDSAAAVELIRFFAAGWQQGPDTVQPMPGAPGPQIAPQL